MKYMILTYAFGSRTTTRWPGRPPLGGPGWSAADFAAVGRVSWSRSNSDLGRVRGAGRDPGPDRPGSCPEIPAAKGRSGGDGRARTPRPRRCWPATGIVECESFRPGLRDRWPGCRRSRAPEQVAARGFAGRAGRSPNSQAELGPLIGSHGPPAESEDLLRRLAPQVLGALVRRYGHFDNRRGRDPRGAPSRAAVQWPDDGIPGNPRGLADHRGLAEADRPAAQRAGPAAPRGQPSPRWTLPGDWLGAGRRTGRPRDFRRHAHPAVHVLSPPRAAGRVADRAHACGRSAG